MTENVDFGADLLIGVDFLKQHNVKIDWEDEVLIIKGMRISMESERRTQRCIRCQGCACVIEEKALRSNLKKKRSKPEKLEDQPSSYQPYEAEIGARKTNKEAIIDQVKEDGEISYFPVHLKQDLVIPARSEAVCMGILKGKAILSDMIIEPVDLPLYGVLAARVACKGSRTVPVKLINVTQESVKVSARTLIGYASNAEDRILNEASNSKRINRVNELLSNERKKIVEQFDLHHLSDDVRNKLERLLWEYADVFRAPNEKLGCTTRVKHRIITEDVVPIAKRPYKVPFGQRDTLSKEINKMLQDEIITESNSPWSAPIVMIAKKKHPGEDAEIRVCIDYRELNAITKTDFFPLPHLQDTIDQLSGSSLFSTMDLASGYFQVELDERDREKSAFSTPFGHYEFKRMPMGLKNSPSTWQRLMYSVLSGLTGDHCLVYLDDIIVYSNNNIDDHIAKLKQVFDRMRDSNLKFKPTKCNFMKKEAKFLGHIISAEGCKTDPEKTEIVKNYPRPRNIKDIRAFLGLCGFYRKFVPKFSEISQPLTHLTKKDVKFDWGEKQDQAFNILKTLLITPPILRYPDFSKPFILTTDASGIGVSAILSQDYNGFEHPISYASRLLNKAEKNYSTIERECLAVIWGVKHYRCYLAGTEFKLITDHAPLRYLLTIKDSNSRLARWAMSLLGYSFTIQHRPGKLNSNADALSRIFNEQMPEVEGAIRTVAYDEEENINEDEMEPIVSVIWDEEKIAQEQNKDENIRKIIENLNENEEKLYYMSNKNILFKAREGDEREDKIVVPTSMINKIMELYHDIPTAAHLGYRKMLDSVKRKFVWKGMSNDIKKYCEQCHSCGLRKQGGATKAPLQKFSVPDSVFERVAIDIVGPLNRTENGNKYILTCMDYLTRYPECIPMPDIQAKTVAKAFVTRVITRHGAPQSLLSDCGSQFLSDMFKEVCRVLKIEKLQTTPYRPQCNGMIERMHRTMKMMLSHFVSPEDNNWDEWLPFVECALRNSIHSSTGETPFFLMHGRDMQLPFHAIFKSQRICYNLEENYASELMMRLHKSHTLAREMLEKSAEKQCLESRKKAKSREYKIGDKVYVYLPEATNKNLAKKLVPKWAGPYRVIKVLGPVNYKIKDIYGDKIKTVHVNRLKPFKGVIQSECETNSDSENDAEYGERDLQGNAGIDYMPNYEQLINNDFQWEDDPGAVPQGDAAEEISNGSANTSESDVSDHSEQPPAPIDHSPVVEVKYQTTLGYMKVEFKILKR